MITGSSCCAGARAGSTTKRMTRRHHFFASDTLILFLLISANGKTDNLEQTSEPMILKGWDLGKGEKSFLSNGVRLVRRFASCYTCGSERSELA
jgi:hypothetical protein